MSQNRRKRREKKKNEKPVVNAITKKDKILGILAIVTIFIAVIALYFYEAIIYFFYLLFH